MLQATLKIEEEEGASGVRIEHSTKQGEKKKERLKERKKVWRKRFVAVCGKYNHGNGTASSDKGERASPTDEQQGQSRPAAGCCSGTAGDEDGRFDVDGKQG